MKKSFYKKLLRKNKASSLIEWIKGGLVIGSLAALAGCAAYVGEGYYGNEGYYYGDEYYVEQGPDLFLFGGDFDRGHDEHNYSHRGYESRRVAYPRDEQRHEAVLSGGQIRGTSHPGGEQGRRKTQTSDQQRERR